MSSFRRTLTGKRYSDGERINGRWVEGDPTVFYFEGSVQPTEPSDIQFLDIGRRQRRAYTIYTDHELKSIVPGVSNSDHVMIDEDEYEIAYAFPWHNDVICHNKYIVTLINSIDSEQTA